MFIFIIPVCEQIRNRGNIIDSHLSFHNHTNKVSGATFYRFKIHQKLVNAHLKLTEKLVHVFISSLTCSVSIKRPLSAAL